MQQRLPMIRKKLEKDLSLPGFPQNKVLAAMVSLHPLILQYYRNKKQESFISELNVAESENDGDGYAPEEKVLLKILEEFRAPGME
jgi:hypothetical protein